MEFFARFIRFGRRSGPFTRHVRKLQENDRQRELDEQVMIARIRELAQKLEHKDQLQQAQARALKAELEAALLRFERRLPPGS